MSAVLTRHQSGSLSYLRGGDGPPLVLLHGLPGSAHTWERAGILLAAHYDVILPDLGGFGASDQLADDLHLDHAFYMEAHGEAVHRLLMDLKLDAVLLGGHSFGAAVALTMMRLFPDLDVRGLVLASAPLFPDPPSSLLLRLAAVPVLGGLGLWAFTGTRMGLRLLYRAAVQNRAAFPVADFARHLTPSGVRQTRRLVRRRLTTDRPSPYQAVAALLPDLDVPALVLWGDQDPFLPARAAKRVVNTLPTAQLSLFENTGHFVPEERPEMTAWHIDDFFRAHPYSTETPSNHRRSSF